MKSNETSAYLGRSSTPDYIDEPAVERGQYRFDPEAAANKYDASLGTSQHRFLQVGTACSRIVW